MALRTIAPSREERDQLLSRFQIAQDDQPEDIEERKLVQSRLREQVTDLAEFLDREVENSREKSLALTHLEEALMWAGKAIFS